MSADQNVRHVNERFYAAEPGDYFRTRLQMLMLVGGKAEELGSLIGAGVEYGGIRIGPMPMEEGEAPDAEPTADHLEAYLTLELQALLHHAAETVLRLYIAHAMQPRVPWVDVAGRRSFGAFKTLVRECILETEVEERDLQIVFWGSSRKPPRASAEDFSAATAGVRAFLEHFAAQFLDDAPIYNAIKHGLGAAAGAAQLLIDGHTLGSGTSIDYLTSTEWVDDARDWRLQTTWVDVQQCIALVDVAVHMIESIWIVGRQRYLGLATDGFRAFWPVQLRPNDLRTEQRAPAYSMGFDLIREYRTEEAVTRDLPR